MPPLARSWRRLLPLLASLVLLGAVGGLLFAWSGLYDISASKGHWAATRAFLSFAMRNSVERHAADIATPPLDDPAQIHLGLAHYEAGCAPCHGAPGEPPNPVTQQAVPKPPYLPDHVADWKPRELFWIVKNGIKYTSMPAWPAPSREDEVWAVVAAVARFPTMSPEEYRRLLRSDTLRDPRRIDEDARTLAAAGPVGEALVACARCHGLDGAGGGAGAFPRLSGLRESYILAALRDYAVGTRPSGVMQPIAVELTDEDARLLARHYAGMAPASPRAAADADLQRSGRSLATRGVAARDIPPCASCHETGLAEALAPRLAGQHAAYLARQLRLWQQGIRGAEAAGHLMEVATAPLTEAEIDAVAHYYAALEPGGPP